MRAFVKGAGVSGLAVAHELAERGFDVTVGDIAAHVGRGASWFAGGMLAPYCERESAEEPVLELGRQACAWWQSVVPELVCRNGTLVVAPPRDAAELERFARQTSGHAWLDGDRIADLEPDLAGRFTRALYFGDEGHLDPRAALEGLHRSLAARGVRFALGGDTGEAEDYDVRLDCTGIARATCDCDLRGVRGEMLVLSTSDITLSRPVRLVHPRIPVYVVPRGDGRFMVGATMIESDAAGPITARSMMELLNAAYALHPAFGEAEIIETGTGVRPAYPDNLPRVTRKGGEIVVNGLYRHGFLLSPAVARKAARMALEQTEPREITNEIDRKRSVA